MYNAIDIAKYVIWYCNNYGFQISNLKLQKILYFIQAEFLVEIGIECFNNQIEAWDFGPVIPDVYHKYKIYGSADIPKSEGTQCTGIIRNSDLRRIQDMINQCAPYSASYLVEKTHNQAPWKNAYIKYCNNPITSNAIKTYFQRG